MDSGTKDHLQTPNISHIILPIHIYTIYILYLALAELCRSQLCEWLDITSTYSKKCVYGIGNDRPSVKQVVEYRYSTLFNKANTNIIMHGFTKRLIWITPHFDELSRWHA